MVLISQIACDPSCEMHLYYNSIYVLVTCLNIYSWNDLSTAQRIYSDGKSDKDVSQLFFPVSEIFVIFPNLENLSIVSNSLNYLDENSFKNASVLTLLFLGSNNISSLHNGTFIGAQSLKFLYLNNNKINIIDSDTFAPLFQLKDLVLSSNELINIHPQTFQNLTNLRYLSLANNFFTELHVSTFQQLKNLEYLFLTSNKLKSLDGKLLSRNTRLIYLDINNCGIEAIERNFFDNLNFLYFLQSEGNDCIDELFYDEKNISSVVLKSAFQQCFDNYYNLVAHL